MNKFILYFLRIFPFSVQVVPDFPVLTFTHSLFFLFYQVIFTDETTVELDRSSVHFVRRSHGEHIRDCHRNERRGYSNKVMFWGCMSVFGPGCLIPVTGTMASAEYQEILGTHLLPVAEAWYGSEHWILQQDNASCHTSASTRQRLQQLGIQVLDWPANAPDMNVIENAWSMLKAKLYHLGTPKSRDDLIKQAQDIWQNDENFREKCMDLVHSMPKRVKSLYNVNGGPTLY
jgi:hypothetical protein